ncbi:MAG: DUF3047 domain-containing protein [Chlamydiota bacterium]
MLSLHLPLMTAALIGAHPAPGGETPFIRAPFAVVSFTPGKPLKDNGWREKIYNRRVTWAVVEEAGGPVLHGTSEGTASMLYRDLDFDANAEPRVSWRWKLMRLPGKGAENDHTHDDYGARVYFFFPGWTFFTSYVLEYVWDNEAPVGTIKTSPSSGKCALVVVNSGTPALGEWVTVERNLREDFTKAFGWAPDRNVGGIGFMTDSDNTRSYAEAYYGPVTIGK